MNRYERITGTTSYNIFKSYYIYTYMYIYIIYIIYIIYTIYICYIRWCATSNSKVSHLRSGRCLRW